MSSNLPTPKPELESVLLRRKRNLGEVIAQLASTGLSSEQVLETLKALYSIPEATMKAIDGHFIESQVSKVSQKVEEKKRKPKAASPSDEPVVTPEETDILLPVEEDKE